ncbi:PREDICTED: putative serine/threonine-protein kinase-like protein CCR3 [Fragaria vesca subsp. vesca]|uniref:putative serine/threonine-protein kinase-like protein CCR3 n=1 Tax=Fragaria vesca subsp. vesca TaxID=101020 RepID=UPI0002C2EDA0|nr:PREDICTED: putative serine/threonine-protein kinase-like protein CCR3 [Fragaria vesca subsp. vesca]
MTKLPFSVFISILTVFFTVPFSHALGSGATLAVSYPSGAVCGLVSGQPTQRIVCYLRGQTINVEPNISFSSISGGRTSLCGLRSGGYALLCYDNLLSQNSTFTSKRVYFNETGELENISVGENHFCASVAGSGAVKCWRGDTRTFPLPSGSDQFGSISSGSGFSCGITKNSSRVRCWGTSTSMAAEIENGFGETAMATIQAGGSHVCGVNVTGSIICRGNNDSGQLNAPPGSYSGLALGDNHSCAIRISNQSVICWGGRGGEFRSNVTAATSFQVIVSGSNFTCGLTSSNFSIICWGVGWPSSEVEGELGLPEILPGRCVQSSCSECGIYPQSQKLCYGSGNICNPCPILVPTSPPSPAVKPPADSPSGGLKTGLLVFCIVGSIGGFAGICTVIYCLWRGGCFGHKKVHNSVQPTITRGGGGSSNNGNMSNNSPPSRSATIRRQGSRIMRRQRSGTSSNKHTERAEEFSLAELAAATNGFALENKIGAGSFGVVYRGKLDDGREVAIKRGETTTKMKKYQEKESAFDSELAFLSRLHHKHLVRLVGYCEEKEERLLVYEYMKNGALYDHLHDKNNVERSSSLINSWKMRIKVALDAARGIEYLHNYAVPPIIHRDIKSSNILIDGNWTGRVSDFGLSLLGPEHGRDYRPMKAAGTVGYIDPEYYGLNLLTAKSDVYGLGVVLLELLTGKRAIFRNSEDGGTPTSVVDYTVPQIMAGELEKVLDPRVGPPEINEAEAVELVAYTAMHCVNLEGKDRPTMTDIVANLERALSLCEESPVGSISSGSIISAE